jgi:hypothetical protein
VHSPSVTTNSASEQKRSEYLNKVHLMRGRRKDSEQKSAKSGQDRRRPTCLHSGWKDNGIRRSPTTIRSGLSVSFIEFKDRAVGDIDEEDETNCLTIFSSTTTCSKLPEIYVAEGPLEI